MNDVNAGYWRSRDGSYYLNQQEERATAGNTMYRHQEDWLNAFIAKRAAELGRPLRVLDFGCGFGRMTRIFAKNPLVEYSGYDFSEPMVRPLREDSPEGIDPSRIRVAPTVGEAFPEEHFDVIFTVAVLIHNKPETAVAITWQLLAMLSPSGALCLVENTLASFSMRENNWHGGCWVHDHVGPFVALWDVEIHPDVLEEQDIYVFSRPSGGTVGTCRLARQDGTKVIDASERRLLGLARVEAAVRGLESEVASFAADQAESHDAIEDSRKMAAEIRLLRERLQASEDERQSLAEVQELRGRVEVAMLGLEPDEAPTDRIAAEQHDDAHLFAPVDHAAKSHYLWNAIRDTEFAHRDPRFNRVCHVFHQEWFGIRAAAGALPGRKLAITGDQVLTARDIAAIARTLRENRVDRLVVHGFSPAMEAFIRAIRASGFDRIYLVWHGAPAMWVFDGERTLAMRALNLVRTGIIRRMQGMRKGMDAVIGSSSYSPLLLNLAPNVELPPRGATDVRNGRNRKRIVMSPSWNLLHKNLVTNLLAAQFNDDVGEFWTMAHDLALDARLSGKLRVLSARTGRAMLDTMRSADLIANVSIVDCHPMVDQEALAVGTPCLRGPLFLDALEDHPYVRATEVENPLSIQAISVAMSRVFSIPGSEMQEMMADYAAGIRAVSLDRYMEFLELS